MSGKVIQEENAVSSQCPMANNKNTDNKIRKIPHKSWFGFWNIIQLIREGNPQCERLAKEYDSQVYKINLNGDLTILNDHESIKICFDPKEVEKQTGFGFMSYNPIVLKGQTPTIFLNGEEHKERKTGLMEYIKYINDNVSLVDMRSLVAEEFKQMPNVNELNTEEANKFNIENVLSRAVGNVVTKILLGEIIDHNILDKWLSYVLEFRYAYKFSYADVRKITDELFNLIEQTSNVCKMDKIITSTDLTKEGWIRELVWMVVFNAYAGIKTLSISSLIAYLKLSDEDKQSISKESEAFIEADKNDEKTMSSLDTLHHFFVEVCRLYPPAPAVFRKPKEDAVIKSTSGQYLLKKNEMISGKLFTVHRDPCLYNQPKDFSLTRDVNKVEENTYTFGDKLSVAPTAENFKCPGHHLTMTIVKMFTMYFTKCDIVATSDLGYTGSNIGRLMGSDVPLQVKTFKYTNN